MITSISGLAVACLLLLSPQHKPTPQEAFAPPDVQELISHVKQQLAAVDAALQAAADADKAAQDLNTARQAHLSVIRDIEELIKQVKYSESKSQSGGSGKPSRGDPKSKPEPKPDPRESDGADHSDPKQGSQPPESKPKNGDPKSGEPDQRAPTQEPGTQPPPPPDTGRFDRADTDARWGLLPPKIQERLMNLHVDDLPERYRTWMDAYIRQLNRLEQGASRP